MRLRGKHFLSQRPGIFLILLFLFSVLSGCSLPRIIILDDPLSPEEHLNLGVSYERSGKEDLAVREYEAATKKLPAGYLYLGNLFFQKKEYASAEKYYRRAIEEYPSFADAYNNLAWLYYTKNENMDEAEGLVRKAIELNPSGRENYQDTLDRILRLRGSSKKQSDR